MTHLSYIDLGGGSKIVYWKDEIANLWNMFSTLTEEAYKSHEEFNADIFFSDSKLNLWISMATKVNYKELTSLYNELIKKKEYYVNF